MIGAGGLGSDVLLALRASRVGTALGGGRFDRSDRHHLRSPDQGHRQPEAEPCGCPAKHSGSATRCFVAALGRTRPLHAPVAGRCRNSPGCRNRMTITTASWSGRHHRVAGSGAVRLHRGRPHFPRAHVLNPFKDFLLALPWAAVVGPARPGGLPARRPDAGLARGPVDGSSARCRGFWPCHDPDGLSLRHFDCRCLRDRHAARCSRRSQRARRPASSP